MARKLACNVEDRMARQLACNVEDCTARQHAWVLGQATVMELNVRVDAGVRMRVAAAARRRRIRRGTHRLHDGSQQLLAQIGESADVCAHRKMRVGRWRAQAA
eukprot:5614548-Pleurochrysis_carterae.AAC.4